MKSLSFFTSPTTFHHSIYRIAVTASPFRTDAHDLVKCLRIIKPDIFEGVGGDFIIDYAPICVDSISAVGYTESINTVKEGGSSSSISSSISSSLNSSSDIFEISSRSSIGKDEKNQNRISVYEFFVDRYQYTSRRR